MLPLFERPINFGSSCKESWEQYAIRMNLPKNRPEREFYRQVAYDNFDDFNYHYPDLLLDDYQMHIINLTVKEIEEHVRYFKNDRVVFWCNQFDEYLEVNCEYIIFQQMYKNRTSPFPPILIDSSTLSDDIWIYGRPLHLIEGTHRTSYLIRMAETRLIEWESTHEFVLLQHNSRIS